MASLLQRGFHVQSTPIKFARRLGLSLGHFRIYGRLKCNVVCHYAMCTNAEDVYVTRKDACCRRETMQKYNVGQIKGMGISKRM